MPTQAIAAWLTGLQVVALLATADVECAAEYLRRQGERRFSRKMATTLPDCDAQDKPPPLNSAQRVEAFKGALWDWGGPSLHVLIMQCGNAGVVEHALDILNQWAPRLHCVDEHSNPIASQLLTTHFIKEHPEDSGFLRLVLLGNEHRGGPVPSFRTSDVLALICESLTADPQFHAVVGLADKLSARSLEQNVEWERRLSLRPLSPPQKAGNRSFNDDEVVAEVRAAVKNRSAKSYSAAVWKLIGKVQGAGSEESKVRRIARKAQDLDRAERGSGGS
jgi:hypothetical protein